MLQESKLDGVSRSLSPTDPEVAGSWLCLLWTRGRHKLNCTVKWALGRRGVEGTLGAQGSDATPILGDLEKAVTYLLCAEWPPQSWLGRVIMGATFMHLRV